jgi:Na+/H+ antiporter NhaD/arsenite permease-like protein
VLIVWTFVLVYIGMIFGGFRGLALDRTGIVLLGMIVLVAGGAVSPEAAWASVDVGTMALLFGLMVVSAQFRLGGFYTLVSKSLAKGESSPRVFLAQIIALSALLSALLANDIICLAVTPVLIEICSRRRLNPIPFLLGLACSANIGSTATLIGNPQNMLIGQALDLHFGGYTLRAIVPTLLGLVACWWIIARLHRGKWELDFAHVEIEAPPFDARQSIKGGIVLAALVVIFIGGWIPRDVAALGAAGVLLLSRRMASPKFLGLVDWNLLILFFGLFVINGALESSGLLARGVEGLSRVGVDLANGAWLFGVTVVLSNTVSNVPAVMLLLKSTTHPNAGMILAMASTLAGNLILVGSIANIIVAEQAGKLGVVLSAREHARTGIPVTCVTLAIAGLWIFWLG